MSAIGERWRDAADAERRSRVLLVGAEPSARHAVGRALDESGRFEVTGEVASADEAVVITSTIQPDVILLEVAGGLAAVRTTLRSILRQAPAAKIVVLAAEEGEQLALEALHAGAVGFLGQGLELSALVRTLCGVAAGEAAISRRFATWLIGWAREEPELRMGMRPVKSRLTAREWEVLDLISAGSSAAAIARDLGVTLGTVRSHVRNLTRKLTDDAI